MKRVYYGQGKGLWWLKLVATRASYTNPTRVVVFVPVNARHVSRGRPSSSANQGHVPRSRDESAIANAALLLTATVFALLLALYLRYVDNPHYVPGTAQWNSV